MKSASKKKNRPPKEQEKQQTKHVCLTMLIARESDKSKQQKNSEIESDLAF